MPKMNTKSVIIGLILGLLLYHLYQSRKTGTTKKG